MRFESLENTKFPLTENLQLFEEKFYVNWLVCFIVNFKALDIRFDGDDICILKAIKSHSICPSLDPKPARSINICDL